ncbi:MAG: MGMT family protein [Bdellovibrionales bacterium]
MVHLVIVSEFTRKVMDQIRKIPKGKVATYKQIAELAKKPYASRGVSWILHSCSTTYKLPWHRVINSQGKISFEKGTYNFRQQKKKLEQEGVLLSTEGQLILKKFQWKKRIPKTRKKSGSPSMFR